MRDFAKPDFAIRRSDCTKNSKSLVARGLVVRIYPSRSSNAPPPPFLCPLLCTYGIDAVGMAAWLLGAGAPQIWVDAFSLCIAARPGPAVAGVEVFLIPAPALAVDHNEPKASPPDVDGFAAGLEKLLAEVMAGLAPEIGGAC